MFGDVIDHVESLSHVKMDLPLPTFFDITDSDENYTTEQLELLARSLGTAQKIFAPRLAIVIKRPTQYALARNLSKFVDTCGFCSEVFTDAEVAVAWLAGGE